MKSRTVSSRTIQQLGAAGGLAAATLLLSTGTGLAADGTATMGDWQKPAWLTDLSLSAGESFDDNVFLVSGQGMKPQSSWITTAAPKVGFNFAPLLGNQQALQTLSLAYSPGVFIYHEAPSEDYTAHKINDAVKFKAGDFSFALDNAFLYNQGSRDAETYALNQNGNVNDKYRNFWAQVPARERRDQIQDRNTVVLQYDWRQFFVRPTASLIYYDLNTFWHTNAAPYKGYQNYPDRYDVNGGADLGYWVNPNMAVTAGYRYGHQYQEQFPADITTDFHYSSSDYQRILLGVEGKPWPWLNVKVTGGPDFRDYNPDAPVKDPHLITYYGEASVTAALCDGQSIAVGYKQWQWVSSTGIAPYFDSYYSLNYHASVTKKLGLDLGGKILEADFSSGNDTSGTAPCLRDDRQYTATGGVSYAITPHLCTTLTYTYDLGDSAMPLTANYEPAYRDFTHQLVSLGVMYKF